MHSPSISYLLAIFLLLLLLLLPPTSSTSLPATNPTFSYIGRWAPSPSSSPSPSPSSFLLSEWSCSTLRFRFHVPSQGGSFTLQTGGFYLHLNASIIQEDSIPPFKVINMTSLGSYFLWTAGNPSQITGITPQKRISWCNQTITFGEGREGIYRMVIVKMTTAEPFGSGTGSTTNGPSR